MKFCPIHRIGVDLPALIKILIRVPPPTWPKNSLHYAPFHVERHSDAEDGPSVWLILT
jgi:hypothetical protein